MSLVYTAHSTNPNRYVPFRTKSNNPNFVSKLGLLGGALGATRTRGLQSRSLTLYPTELRALMLSFGKLDYYSIEHRRLSRGDAEFFKNKQQSKFPK